MPFKEQTAWVMTVLLGLVGAHYARSVIGASLEAGATAPPDIGLIASLTIILVAGSVVAHILMAIVSPNDANAPEDERDKLVLWRAGNIAGYVLGFGAFAGLWHFYWLQDGNLLFHIIAGSLVLSQMAEYILSILFYRRGALV